MKTSVVEKPKNSLATTVVSIMKATEEIAKDYLTEGYY